MIILIIIAIVCFMIAIKLRNEQGGWFYSDNNSSYTNSTSANKHYSKQTLSLQEMQARL